MFGDVGNIYYGEMVFNNHNYDIQLSLNGTDEFDLEYKSKWYIDSEGIKTYDATLIAKGKYQLENDNLIFNINKVNNKEFDNFKKGWCFR